MPNTPTTIDGEQVRRELLDLTVMLTDTCDDMKDLLPSSPYSMSRTQLQISGQLDAMRSICRALLATLHEVQP